MHASRIETTILPASFGVTAEEVHPRAVEMAEKMREAAGAFGGCTWNDLIAAGFTGEEIQLHEAVSRSLATAMVSRAASPQPDRVQDIITKAIASAAHIVPRMAGVDLPDDAIDEWGVYCTARAAWKIDPWSGQRERCIGRLDVFLRRLPLLPRERSRIVFALAAHMKAHRHD